MIAPAFRIAEVRVFEREVRLRLPLRLAIHDGTIDLNSLNGVGFASNVEPEWEALTSNET